MKKFSSTQTILAIAASVILAVGQSSRWIDILGVGVDHILTITPNYTMSAGNDVLGYDSLKFVMNTDEETELELNLGTLFKTLLRYIIPSSVTSKLSLQDPTSVIEFYQKRTWKQPIDILDARTADNDFNRTGFDLISDDAFPIFDWDNYESSQEVQAKLRKILAPHVYDYYPNATHFLIYQTTNRAPHTLKAANTPHIDISPDDDERDAFFAKHGFSAKQKMLSCLVGREEECQREGEEVGVILGAWIPTMNTPVCDWPLALMDSSSSTSDDAVTTLKLTNEFTSKNYRHQIFSLANHDPKQRWYYYSYQKPNEMLLFHHYSRDKTYVWGNPHSSISLTGCSDEYESRASFDMRIVVFFKKEKHVGKEFI